MSEFRNNKLEYWELKTFFKVKGILNILLIIILAVLIFLNLILYHSNKFELAGTRLIFLNLINLGLLISFAVIYLAIQFKKAQKKIKSKLEKQYKKISLLFELRDKILTCTSNQEIANTTSHYIAQVFESSSGVIYHMHRDYNYLEAIGSWGKMDSYPRKLSSSECLVICAHPIPSGNPLLEEVYAPMIVDNELLGLIRMEYFKSCDKEIAEQNHEMIDNIASFMGLALANSKLRESLKIESTHDALTGLSNRRELDEYLVKHLNLALRQKTSLCLIMFDLDYFKKFNDSFGHEAGDLLLTAVADLLRKESRLSDVVCRFGGEEFIWVLYDCPLSVAKRQAEELREKVRTLSIKYNNQVLPMLTISAGIAAFPGDGDNAYELIEAADKALYEAKEKRNTVVVFSETLKALKTLDNRPK